MLGHYKGMSVRILFTSGREPEYPRNAVIRAALSRHFEVFDITDRSRYYLERFIRIGARLSRSAKSDYDLMFVGFLGQPLMQLASRLTPKPILFDAFLSVYDTLCFDRKVISPRSLAGKLAFWLDRSSCTRADRVLLDTQAHVDYFQETFRIPESKFRSLFVGCDETLFYPRPMRKTTRLVLYYGSFLPLQGIDVILKAAKLIEKRSEIKFRIIGSGIESNHIHAISDQLGLCNVSFLPPVPLSQLPDHIQEATVCLGGHFGSSAKAGRVIAGKTFQLIAMGKPTVVGDNKANHELLQHGYDAWFCQMDDPHALADAILRLIDDPGLCTQLGENAHQTFIERASIPVLSDQLKQIVESMVS